MFQIHRGLLAACSAAALLASLSACGDRSTAAQAGGNAPSPTVGVLQVAPRAITLTTELPGRTAAHRVAEVRPQVEGIIQSRLFTEGGEVKAGQALYQIDSATYEADLSSAKASLARAQANAITAQLKAQRYAELVGIDAVSRQANDDAQAALKQAQADVAVAQAAQRTAQIRLNYTRVTAPISGRIGRSSVTPGALVTANQATALATLQQLDPIYVDVTQSSSELLRLQRALANGTLKRSGQSQARVKLVLEDGRAYTHEGQLQFSEVSVDTATGTVTLRATFPNPQHTLLPGMYVRAVLEEGVDEQALLVPQQAVSRNSKGQATAMVVGDDGTAQPRVLRTERSIGDQWRITEGLKAGDRVIVEGLQKIRPGAPVKAQPWATGASAAASAAR